MGTEDGSGPAEATCLASQCYLCGCVSLDTFSVGTAQYLRCRECGLVSRCPSSLLDSEICDLYGSDYYSDSERYPAYAEQPEWLRMLLERRLDQLKQLCPQKGRMLDVGCGLGHFLELARRDGWEASGTEVSEVAARKAGARLGVDIVLGELGDVAVPPDSFEAVCFWDTLEHMTNPRQQLAAAYRMLQPRGVIAVSTPNVTGFKARLQRRRWKHFAPASGHIMHFSPRTLSQLLTQVGFRIAHVETWGFLNVTCLLGRIPYSVRGLSVLQSLVDRGVGVLGFGENLVAYARKPG